MTPITMPSLADLCVQLHRTFTLRNAEGFKVEAELVTASEGIAMNARYNCYAAVFALPAGTSLSQAVYAVQCDSSRLGEEWPLLLTPVLPGADGRALMEAVFHVPAPTVAAGSKPVATEEYEPSGSIVA